MAELTGRELLAAMAMQGMLSSPNGWLPPPSAPMPDVPCPRVEKLAQLARDSFAVADAMIAASFQITAVAGIPPGTARFVQDGKVVGEITNIGTEERPQP